MSLISTAQYALTHIPVQGRMGSGLGTARLGPSRTGVWVLTRFRPGSDYSNQILYWTFEGDSFFSPQSKNKLQQPIQTKAVKVLTPFC
jgi:hypothetical protein